MSIFSGMGMRITRADGTGKMPWSPTVVNIQRQKARRGKRALTIMIILALVACFACSGYWAVMQMGKKKPPAASIPTPVPTQITVKNTPVPMPTIHATPTARWTPMPGYGDWIKFRVEPIGGAK